MNREIDFINSCIEKVCPRYYMCLACVGLYPAVERCMDRGSEFIDKVLHSRIGFYSPSGSKEF